MPAQCKVLPKDDIIDIITENADVVLSYNHNLTATVPKPRRNEKMVYSSAIPLDFFTPLVIFIINWLLPNKYSWPT